MKLGYILIHSSEEDQLDQLQKVCQADKYFYDVISSTLDERPNFANLFHHLNQSDELICYDLNHICFNGEELVELLQNCHQQKITFTVASDALQCKGKELELFIYALTSVRVLDRSFHLQRQKEGIEQAALQGIFAGRPKIDLQEHMDIFGKWKQGEISAVNAAKAMNLSRATFYRRMSEFEALFNEQS